MIDYQERIEFLAYHDSQTGFYNREKLFDRLRHSRSEDLGCLGAMLLIGIKDSEKIEVSLDNVLIETLYYLVGIEIMSFFETISVINPNFTERFLEILAQYEVSTN